MWLVVHHAAVAVAVAVAVAAAVDLLLLLLLSTAVNLPLICRCIYYIVDVVVVLAPALDVVLFRRQP